MATFSDIPEVVINYVRDAFGAANDHVSRFLSNHPSMHEPALDLDLIVQLTAVPPAFFAAEQASVELETHFLGGRAMYDRWEIADIGLVISLRQNGHLQERKVALLQTKRLYSREIPVTRLSRDDFAIGIGRLADRTDPTVPLTHQRRFSFDGNCVFAAMRAGDEQTSRIKAYMRDRGIPVYYAFYNPVDLPFQALTPAPEGQGATGPNDVGCRVQPATEVFSQLAAQPMGQSPSFDSLKAIHRGAPEDPFGDSGWRLENFVADEVLRCREGRLFTDVEDADLEALFYGRSAPIAAAIVITIDIAKPEEERPRSGRRMILDD
jgi:hypothetical protein